MSNGGVMLPWVMRETTTGLLATVNGRAAKASHVAPVGEFPTHTWKAPGVAIWAAVTGTLSWVLLTNVTVGDAPFTKTTELGVKPVPFSVSVKAELQGTVVAGLRLVRVSGVAAVL
jgi:hypothetical protein